MDHREDERRRAELRAICNDLQALVEDLAPILLPDGRREGMDWREGARGSRSIRLRGPNAGVYRNFEEGTPGCDMLEAITTLLCNGNKRDAIAWARAFLGRTDYSDEALRLAERKAAERRRASEADKRKLDEKRRRQARGIWHGADPLEGSPADEYLMGRGIDVRKLERVPGALRFNPETWCKERGGKYPAMVSALFRFGDPQLVAVHRTFIERQPGGGWGKAAIDTPRSILGSWPGALIPIARGETGRQWSKMEEGETVALGEGIEEALSVALVRPSWRVGAVGFVGNFGQILFPHWQHVMPCINNDPDGSDAAKAMFGDPATGRAGAINDLEAAGHVVRALRPPPEYKDWNDLLTGKRRDE